VIASTALLIRLTRIQTLTASISNVGSYIVTGGLDVGETSGTLTLRATYKGSNYDKVFTLGKSLAGDAGFPGGIGPPGSNLLANGLFQYVDSATGLLANWDYGSTVAQSYDNTGGIDGGRCMLLGSYNSTREIWNTDVIPVDPYLEYLDCSVWLRSATSGHQVYLAIECFDEYGRTIQSYEETMNARLRMSGVPTNPGTTSLRVAKIATYDLYAASSLGYQNSYNYIHVCSGGDIWQWPNSRAIALSIPVVSVNTASSNSWDTLTLGNTLTMSLSSNQYIGLSKAGNTHKYWPGGTTFYTNSEWTKYEIKIGGENAAWTRWNQNRSGAPGIEAQSFRPRTRFVRFGILAYTGGTESDLWIDDMVVRRRQHIPGETTYDPYMLLGAGNFQFCLTTTCFVNMGSYSTTMRWSQSSGYSGGGMMVLNPGSNDGMPAVEIYR